MGHQKVTFASVAAQFLGLALTASLPLESKQGLAVGVETKEKDLDLLTSKNSPISWYYTWSTYPSDKVDDSVVFFPMVHNIDTLEEDNVLSRLDDLPDSATHLLTFNEPDEESGNGGSDMSPEDAAEAYIDEFVALRDGDSGRTWNISHPAVSGSPRGLDWLKDFNESCYDIEPDSGCPADFVSVHWYGEFEGLAGWLGTLNDFYNPKNATNVPFYITEMAVPQADGEANIAMMNQSMEYLDGLDYVHGYAWFGAFRKKHANDWTGDDVSLLDNQGDLTDLGREYLGGDTEEIDDDDDDDDDEDVATALARPSLVGLSLVVTAVGALLI